jgi:hypothetical protein
MNILIIKTQDKTNLWGLGSPVGNLQQKLLCDLQETAAPQCCCIEWWWGMSGCYVGGKEQHE